MIYKTNECLLPKSQEDSFGIDERLWREYLRVELGSRYSDLPKQPIAGIRMAPVMISTLSRNRTCFRNLELAAH